MEKKQKGNATGFRHSCGVAMGADAGIAHEIQRTAFSCLDALRESEQFAPSAMPNTSRAVSISDQASTLPSLGVTS